MKFKEYILMSLRDLWKRKGRTILTSLGITIGTLLIVTMVGLGSGVKQLMNDMVNDQDSARNISVNPYRYMTEEEQDNATPTSLQEDYSKPITNDFIKDIEDMDQVENVTAILSGNANYIKYNNKKYKCNTMFTGYNENAKLFPDYEIEKVRKNNNDNSLKPIEAGEELDNTAGEVLIGEQVLEKMNVTAEDAVGTDIEILVKSSQTNELQSKKFKIKGIINGNFQNGNGIVMNINDASQLLSFIYTEKDYFKSHGYEYATVVTKTIEDVDAVGEKIKDLNYLYSSSADMADAINENIGSINTAFAVLGVIVLVVSAIGIINTMSMAVMERTKSIGVMKSVGASSGAIRTMFLIQSSLIGVIGGGFGILFGVGINKIVQSIATSMIAKENLPLTISVGLPVYWLLIIFIFAMVIALVSGIAPANKAAKLDPIEALRR